MNERLRVFILIFIMTAVAVGSAGISVFNLYRTALEEESQRLVDIVKSQAGIMEAMARFNARHLTEDVSGSVVSRTMEEIADAHVRFEGFGKTGEFALAKKGRGKIVFLLKHRHALKGPPETVLLSSKLAEPMRRALAGESGTIVGLDYRGKQVLAAYEPVAELDYGLVAKIDFEEIQAPFMRAGLLAGAYVLTFVLLGSVLFWYFTKPLLRSLKESEVRYRTIFENTPNSIFLMTDVVEECNDQASHLFACGREEMVGHSLVGFSPPAQPNGRDSAEAAGEYNEAALSGVPQFFDWQYQRKDGTLIDTEVFLKAIEVEGRKLNLVIMRDIAERRQAEETLQERNEFIETILGNLPIGLIVLGLEDRKFRYVNKKSEEILGWSKGDLDGIDHYWEHVFPDPSMRQKMIKKIEADWASGDPERLVREYAATKSSGETADILVVEIPMFEKGLLIGTFQDITTRKRAENEIRQLNQELEARVIERTRELELANREMEAFSYSVSHDLRAPLRAIDGFSSALLENYADQLDVEGKSYLHYLQEGSCDMNDLIDGLLKLSRSTRGEMARESVDLSALVVAVAEELRQAEPERQVAVHVEQKVKVDADPRLLKAVMENLLGNAWKYTGKVADACIEFGVQLQEGETVFFVQDNGAGFDMTYADKLFLPFHRLHKTGEFSGTGIGLATVQRIIHRHGGRIWAKGAVEDGATFYFTLKAEEKPHG